MTDATQAERVCPDCGGTGGYQPAYVSFGEIVGPDACGTCQGHGVIAAPTPPAEPAGELCGHCNERYTSVYRVPDELWAEVTGRTDGGGLLCMACCEAKAGRTIYWEGSVGGWPPAGEELPKLIAELQAFRKSHVDWAEYFESHPDVAAQYIATGQWDDVNEHRRIVAVYDAVIAKLRTAPDAEREVQRPRHTCSNPDCAQCGP